VAAAQGQRLALVGGAVRDLLLHRRHSDPWRGLPDLDLVLEGRAGDLVEPLRRELSATVGASVPMTARAHGRFGTVELQLQLPDALGGTWLLDLASARQENYPIPAENPQITPASLEQDLSRRDFTVNAMALELTGGSLVEARLLDPHGGQHDLARRQLRFLHGHSLRDDPTRLVRAARYASRLDFELAPDSLAQVRTTLASWPWKLYYRGTRAPQALGTRLRMELQALLCHETWHQALKKLHRWGGLVLLDPNLDSDGSWIGRLHWRKRIDLPLLLCLVACSSHPSELAKRLQLPDVQQHWLMEMQILMCQLNGTLLLQTPAGWCEMLENTVSSSKVVGLAIVAGAQPRKFLLRWLFKWRHVKSQVTAKDLIDQGWEPGPALGQELKRLRYIFLDQAINVSSKD